MLAALIAPLCLLAAAQPTSEPIGKPLGEPIGKPDPAQAPRTNYHIRYNPVGPALDIRLSVTGINPHAAQTIRLSLSDAGEWLEVDALYLRGFRSEPIATRSVESPTRWLIQPPDDWDGSLAVSYSIPLIERGTILNQHRGLLPWFVPASPITPGYAISIADNTLVRPLIDDAPLDCPATITLEAQDQSIFTGWAGLFHEKQTISFPGGPPESPFAFAPDISVLRHHSEGTEIEVARFAGDPEDAPAIMALARSLAPAYAASCGRPLDRPLRILITDKGGGQWMDRAIMMQAADAGQSSSPYFRHLFAHELFHQWLGGYAHAADESTVWFMEGFTDYLSLWHLAATGLVPRDWFASRLVELDGAARASPAYGETAFGDSSIGWRDGDGPCETLAYKGGAALAFQIDVELRRLGRPGLSEMIRDLGRDPAQPYTLTTIRQWMQSHGLAEFYDAFIAAPALPELGPALELAGFRLLQTPTSLAYAGFRTDGDEIFGTIVEIDPDGPAAAAGLTVGDRITGFWPTRAQRPQVRGDRPPLAFGLEYFQPGTTANIGVRRGDEDLTVTMVPRPIEGGVYSSYKSEGADSDAFFGR